METSYLTPFLSLMLAKVLTKCDQSLGSHHSQPSSRVSLHPSLVATCPNLAPPGMQEPCGSVGAHSQVWHHPTSPKSAHFGVGVGREGWTPWNTGIKELRTCWCGGTERFPGEDLEPPFSPSLLWSSPFVWHTKVCNCTRGLTFPKSLRNAPRSPRCKEQGWRAFPARAVPRKQPAGRAEPIHAASRALRRLDIRTTWGVQRCGPGQRRAHQKMFWEGSSFGRRRQLGAAAQANRLNPSGALDPFLFWKKIKILSRTPASRQPLPLVLGLHF